MEQKPVLIAPSLLASDFLKLGEEAAMLNRSEADWFHLDVMDGRFVPNISFGLPVIAAIRKATQKTCDVHLMIEEPGKYAEDFQKAGADMLTVHYEACPHLHRNIQQIKKLGMKAGVALNPHTPVSLLENIIRDLDLVLIMSVNPGFGGQSFIEQTYHKIAQTRQLINDNNAHALIEVDGGINAANAGQLIQAGANVLVAGSAVFASPNPEETIRELKAAAVAGLGKM
ncbi:ribulose-phosphate 3-epimerase [Chitinophaga sp. Cy-1792]|uniref:ribulose-phosphate 3-epimerase n=1 Tax=Chitinophaga sp. Cy-1792 TaxID=2608339 RepID=UPI001423520B|nr:ribulose-phosphate 3-epimerase [Chitinophaga sp. Cy-1792]NIG54259.1 ribulose-phosphate 3-epimerase [Chitinophaga sp. Cy-1792]